MHRDLPRTPLQPLHHHPLPLLLLLLLCVALPLSPRPASCQSLRWGRTASCPDFRAYTQLHWDMSLGHVAPKWLITEDVDGLADRLVNAVSAFLVALITNRALCIVPAQEFGHQPGMEVAYDAPFIDWTCRKHSSSSSSSSSPGDVTRPSSGSGMGYPWEQADEVLTDTLQWGNLNNKTSALYQSFILSDLTQRPENDSSAWRLWIQRGLSIGLFHNPHHRQQLIELGLRPATAFGCIASYLFRPSREALGLVPQPTLNIMTDSNVLKIGIQIRCGDAKIKKQLEGSSALRDKMSDFDFDRIAKPFFECAAALERDLIVHSGPVAVSWYLMTDTLAVRNKAAAKFGAKLLFFNATAIEFFQSVTGDGFQRTVMEHWLLQQADFHVISSHSGLGRTAAFASLRENNVFTLTLDLVADMAYKRRRKKSAERMNGRGCSLTEHDGIFELYDKWSGI